MTADTDALADPAADPRSDKQETARRTVQALATALVAVARKNHDSALASVREEIEDGEDELARLTVRLGEVHRALGSARAELGTLEGQGPELNEDAATKLLKFLRNLPGILEVSVTPDGEIAVSFHTACLYQGKEYDMGDFTLYMPFNSADKPYHIVCTRSGLKSRQEQAEPDPGPRRPRETCGQRRCRGCRDAWAIYRKAFEEWEESLLHRPLVTVYSTPLYWRRSYPNYAPDYTGPGSFCFGTDDRSKHIEQYWRQRRLGEFVHLVIATMCMVNDGDWYRLPQIYNCVRVSRKRQQAWRFGREPGATATIRRTSRNSHRHRPATGRR